MSRLSQDELRALGLGAALVVLAALLPLLDQGFYLSMGVNIMLYAALCTAWTLFSGPTHYISLATAAFYGLGTYSVGLGIDILPYPILLGIAALVGAALAGLVGAATLRISGVYFVIFTFGLTELIRQLVTWYEVNVSNSIGRYVFLDITQEQIYWQLLALGAVLFLATLFLGRSRLGFALRIIGADETVARHCGIDTTRAKVLLFALSAVFMTLAGAIMAPRWTYIDPAIAFNPVTSFQVLIMALLGGVQRLYGPLLGVIPLALLFEYLGANFPNHYSILLGAVFMVIVYLLPNGVVGLAERLRRTASPAAPAGKEVA